MGRYRSRSYSPRRSLTPPPPPPRRRYDDPRDRRSHLDHRRRSPPPTGLLVRNIALDSRPEDLRIPFERFGPVKDVYLPKNYYTGEPRGFGFVKFRNAEDAAEAKHQLNHCVIGGREIAIVFAEENRKTPREMRASVRPSGRYGGGSSRRSPPRFSRRRSYSRSLSPARHDYSDRDRRARDHYSPSRSRSLSRSVSPHGASRHKPTLHSRSPRRNGGGPLDKMYSVLDQRDANSHHPESKHNPHDKRDGEEWRSTVANKDARKFSRSPSRSPPYHPVSRPR